MAQSFTVQHKSVFSLTLQKTVPEPLNRKSVGSNPRKSLFCFGCCCGVGFVAVVAAVGLVIAAVDVVVAVVFVLLLGVLVMLEIGQGSNPACITFFTFIRC